MATKLPGWIIQLIVSLLGPLLAAMTPQLKSMLAAFVADLHEGAKTTDSPIDDIFVRFLAALLEIELPE